MQKLLRISEKDNVVTCLQALAAGDSMIVDGTKIEVRDDIPVYHKMAATAIPAGGPVRKYGEIIGIASRDIAPGQWVHIHNINSTRGRGDLGGEVKA